MQVPRKKRVEVGRAADRDALEARRARLVDMFEMGDIGRDEYQRRMTVLKAAEVELEAKEADIAELTIRPEAIDWDRGTPEEINRILRSMFEPIEMTAAMQPIPPKLRVPDWERPA